MCCFVSYVVKYTLFDGKHKIMHWNSDLEQKTGSEQDNVLPKTLVFSKLDCFYINMVSCVERFVLFCASLHYLMVNTGFCMRIVIWNKKWG